MTMNQQEKERKIQLVLSDPRFIGTYEQAKQVVEELYK